jgi:poly-gamma-glutamate capsule biosynthesis protein CapA/YwtB (metallophosphatase superfamily)
MRISVAGVGDIMLGTDYPENHLPDDDGAGFLNAVGPLLRNADIAFGNLEGVLLDGGEAAKQCKDPQACYLFRTPTRYAQHLRDAGFNVMSLANNHARDFGEAGRDSSMAALDQVGILHSGREGDVASWQEGELRVAMIAFSPTVDSWPLLEIDVATAAVAKLAAEHQIVIVSFHGGAEGFDGAERIGFAMEYAYGEPRGNVVKFSHAVIDAGADLVLGHGPHVPRAMELYKNHLIAYSLGNFATYYGISVAGPKGYAPIVMAQLDGFGQFISGRLYSNLQIRPGGPQPDSKQKALRMIQELTQADFPDGSLLIANDSQLSTAQP